MSRSIVDVETTTDDNGRIVKRVDTFSNGVKRVAEENKISMIDKNGKCYHEDNNQFYKSCLKIDRENGTVTIPIMSWKPTYVKSDGTDKYFEYEAGCIVEYDGDIYLAIEDTVRAPDDFRGHYDWSKISE